MSLLRPTWCGGRRDRGLLPAWACLILTVFALPYAYPESQFQRLGEELGLSAAVDRVVSLPLSDAEALVVGLSSRSPEVAARFVRALSASPIAGSSREELLLLRLTTEMSTRQGDEIPETLVEALADRLNKYRDGTLRRMVLEGMAAHPSRQYGATLAERGAQIVARLERTRDPEPPELRREAEAYLRAIEAHGRAALGLYGARIGERSRHRPTVVLANRVVRSLME